MKHKNIDVLFLQETLSDIENTADWIREFNGMAILSHFTSLSGGVAMLFSRNFISYSYNVEEVIKERLLKISASFENSSFVFVCVYAPTNALDRMFFLNTLDKNLSECNNDDFLKLRGDFNCTESGMDRNHVAPRMQSRKRLFQHYRIELLMFGGTFMAHRDNILGLMLTIIKYLWQGLIDFIFVNIS